jgi:hypothetical protein
MAARSPLKVLERDETNIVGLWHNVFVSMFRGTATLEALRRIAAHQKHIDKRFVDGYCALAVVGMASVRMDAAVREEAAHLSQNPGQNLKAIAQVIEGTGLGAATTRMIASGLMLVRKTPVPSKLFDDVRTAAQWLLPHIKPDPPGATAAIDDLVAAIEQAWAQK